MSSTNTHGEYVPRSAADVSDWDHEADVVVLGHGGGGGAVAVEASRSGADVLVVEKTDGGGGTTEAAGAYFYLGGGTPLQEEHGVDDSSENMYEYLQARNPNTSEERIRLFAEHSLDHYHWLSDLGLEFDGPHVTTKSLEPPGSFLKISGSEDCYPFDLVADPAARGHHIDDGGKKLFELLDETARDEGADFLFETEAERLVMDWTAHEVVGVEASTDGESVTIRADDGVVIATSGFSFNEEMVAEHAPEYVEKGVALGTGFVNYPDVDLHDGSGINMARAVGGTTTKMDKILAWVFINPYIVYPPDDGSLNEALVSGVLVNGEGRRFISEDRYGGDIGQAVIEDEHAEELPGNPTSAHLILDDDLFQMGGGVPDDTIVDFDPATLVEADTVGELAEKIDLPQAVLADTIEFYSDRAADGEDPEFHKNEEYLEPIDTGPYYAYNLRPSAFPGGVQYHTLGGLRVTTDGEVLNSSNQPIDGLYAAGRSVAGIPGEGYESGISLSTITFFGRRTGRAAAGDPTA